MLCSIQKIKSKKIKRGHQLRRNGLVLVFFITNEVECLFRGAGGGKCPEEEHTTCSGGPTIIVTSAVYGERENILKIFYFKNIKK